MLQEYARSPAIHLLPKTLYGPCDESRALVKAARGVRWTEEISPVFFGNKIIGSVFGDRHGKVYASKINALDLMGFPNGYTDVLTAVRAGKTAVGKFTVVASGGIASNVWASTWNCLASSQANAYSGTASTARQFTNTSDGAIYSGEAVSSATKHLSSVQASMSTGPATYGHMYWIYDRVLSYDKCPVANTTTTMTNSLTAQRWTGSGYPGLRICLTEATVTLGATASRFTGLVYANEIGTGSKNVPLSTQIDLLTASPVSASFPSPILSNNIASVGDIGPFLPLGVGDIGVSSITSYIQSATNTGDLCFSLIRPLVMFVGPPSGNVIEHDFLRERLVLPRIYDTTCVGMLLYAGDNSGVTFTLTGNLNYVWG